MKNPQSSYPRRRVARDARPATALVGYAARAVRRGLPCRSSAWFPLALGHQARYAAGAWRRAHALPILLRGVACLGDGVPELYERRS